MKLEPIDTSTTAGKARVMQLAAEGRLPVFSRMDSPDVWRRCHEPSWAWDRFHYAIIAEPVGPEEVWLVISEFTTFNSQHDAERLATSDGGKAVLYRRADLAGRDE